MTTEKAPAEDIALSEIIDRTSRAAELGSLDVWSRSAPIRLAGYEDDLAEPHILPGID